MKVRITNSINPAKSMRTYDNILKPFGIKWFEDEWNEEWGEAEINNLDDILFIMKQTNWVLRFTMGTGSKK